MSSEVEALKRRRDRIEARLDELDPPKEAPPSPKPTPPPSLGPTTDEVRELRAEVARLNQKIAELMDSNKPSGAQSQTPEKPKEGSETKKARRSVFDDDYNEEEDGW